MFQVGIEVRLIQVGVEIASSKKVPGEGAKLAQRERFARQSAGVRITNVVV